MSITAGEIKKVILEEDDFGFELRVGSILNIVNSRPVAPDNERIIGGILQHGGTYKDQVTGKTRQFDYRSAIVRQDSKAVYMALECKNLNPDLPLVICGRLRNHNESYHVFIGQEAGFPVLKKSIGSFYRTGEFVGKSLLRIKEKNGKHCADNDSEIYDKWSQALASSYDLASDALNRTKRIQNGFVMPVVVLPDDSLWCAELDPEGKLSKNPAKTDACKYFVEHELKIGQSSIVLTHIHFVTCKGLRTLLEWLVNDTNCIWDQIFHPRASIIDG